MEYIFHILILVSIYGILALAQNAVMGMSGLLTISGAAFYGIGAYVAAVLSVRFGWGILPVFIAAPIIAGVIAAGIGSTFARFRDDYFMLATLGFLMIFHTVVRNWESLTGGAYGIPGIPKPHIFGIILNTPLSFLFLAGTVMVIITAVFYFISRSSFGRVLRAIREDEDALKIFGYQTSQYKLIIFVIGAAASSFAGVLFASYITFVDPNSFTINESILLWAMIILGGIGRNQGALLGALLLIVIPELLRFVGFPDQIAALLRQCLYGAVLVILMLYRPRGILGKYKL